LKKGSRPGKQKLSVLRALALSLPHHAGPKVFLPPGGPVLFLQKKKFLLYLA
jgi:hypothetical protein